MGEGGDEGRRPRLSVGDLQQALRPSGVTPVSLLCRACALTSPPFWHTGAGPDPDPTPRLPSENPQQVYYSPEDPILRALDLREPPRVIPDLAGAGPVGSELAKGTTCDSARPFLLQSPLSLRSGLQS